MTEFILQVIGLFLFIGFSYVAWGFYYAALHLLLNQPKDKSND